jgi:ketosteroid isomerase-like protein
MKPVRVLIGAGLAVVLVAGGAGGVVLSSQIQNRVATTPKAAVDALLDADRAFSSASGRTELVAGLSAMFAPDIVMPAPPSQLLEGMAKVVEALRSTPDSAHGKAEWAPARGGISADGQHGFTLGYLTLTRADGQKVPMKYLAYWVKRPEGWRVAAYKRGRRGDGATPGGMMEPALPAAIIAPTTDAATIGKHRDSLDQAERAFSAEAQKIGLGPAFAKYGSADAVNMGGPADVGFVVGAEAIARAVGGGGSTTSSPVSWAPEKVIVASSGDLGVTIGWIRQNAKATDGSQTPPTPFFTIWRRASPTAPWRYVAE